MTQQIVELGKCHITPGVQSSVKFQEVLKRLARHATGDWGDLDEEDEMANWEALETGDRLLSAYNVDRVRIWIITEGHGDDRLTTVLLPDEY